MLNNRWQQHITEYCRKIKSDLESQILFLLVATTFINHINAHALLHLLARPRVVAVV